MRRMCSQATLLPQEQFLRSGPGCVDAATISIKRVGKDFPVFARVGI